MTIRCFAICAIAFTLIINIFNVTAQAKVVLKLAHYADDSHPAHKAAKMFAKGVSTRTHGAVKVDIFSNSMLGNSPEILQPSNFKGLKIRPPP